MPSAEFDTLIAALGSMQRLGTPSVADMRAGWEKLASRFVPAADLSLQPVMAGGVPAEWTLAPGVAADRGELHLHGGGCNIGSVASYREFTGRISRAAQARAVGGIPIGAGASVSRRAGRRRCRLSVAVQGHRAGANRAGR